MTPDSLTFDDILDAVQDGIVPCIVGWNALGDVGEQGRDEARRRICAAIAKQRGGVSRSCWDPSRHGEDCECDER